VRQGLIATVDVFIITFVTTAFPIRLYRIKTVREGHYF